MDLQERVSQWIIMQKKIGITQVMIAKAWGVSVQYISSLKKGTESIGMDVIKRILDFDKNINLRWLILGEGEMYEYKRSRKREISNENRYGFNAVYEDQPNYKSEISLLIESNYQLIKSIDLLREDLEIFVTKKTNPTKKTKYK